MLILGAPTPFDEERRLITALFAAGLAAVDPEQAVKRALVVEDGRLSVNSDDIEVGGGVHLIAIGKAAVAMTRGAFAVLGETIRSGDVLTKEGHVSRELPPNIRVFEAAHPIPDARGVAATRAILDRLAGLAAGTVVLALISGGGSALLEAPRDDLTLGDLAETTRLLLQAGAPIDALNSARAPLSRVKAGGLRRSAPDATWLTLVLSDVLSNDPRVIASGPTVPDSTTCADALAILTRYGIAIPPAARAGLESGAFESPKPGDARFKGHQVHMIATPRQSLEAAAAMARAAGITPYILSDEIEGESREVGKVHAALARSVAHAGTPFAKPCVILSGGETTVTVRAKGGRGGRATEFLLGCAIALQGQSGVHVLAADTDGIDGVEDNAGAIVTPDTLARARAMGMKAQEFLDANNAYGFFAPLSDLVIPGPTFTNVNDFRALLIT